MRIDGLDAEDARTRRERTLREARATARIDHPNVVRVYDVVDEGERLWIVMELVMRPLPRTHHGRGRPARPARDGTARTRPGGGAAPGARPGRPAPGHQTRQRPGGEPRRAHRSHGLRHRRHPGRQGAHHGRHAGRLARLHGPRAGLRPPAGPAVRRVVPRRDPVRGHGRPLPLLPRHDTGDAARRPVRGARTPRRPRPVAGHPGRPAGEGADGTAGAGGTGGVPTAARVSGAADDADRAGGRGRGGGRFSGGGGSGGSGAPGSSGASRRTLGRGAAG